MSNGPDDGSPYGGDSGNPDRAYAPRVARPDQIAPGIAPVQIPVEVARNVGTQGRAPLHVDRPVEPTALPFDPRYFVGVQPSRLDKDPRGTIGSATDLYPPYVVLSRLKSKGAEPWMLQWVYRRGQRALEAGEDIRNQCLILAHFGDAAAGQLAAYIDQVNATIRAARNQADQAMRARMGLYQGGR